MDPVTVIFYGLVCGTLGAFAASLGRRMVRILVGGGIGIASALLLPLIRNMMGY